ncbi:restriction endonuclease [Streptomyces sp. ME19-01-6]|uniref:restriction endonuclease n=1 Tax=Streptomyces sp. ME19-01-6 TaxID=3028686 RepID=UPI0029A42497|nr:restriction endonuclease [Streptomyces sp. ME19-01-6]MDX3232873.1 restriction endonuclease [Streptomyces sp. ME19-01-6]
MSSTTRRRAARLHLGLTGWALTLFALYVAVRTWPVQAAITAALIGLTGTVAALHPARRTRRLRGRRRVRITVPPLRRATNRDLAAYRALDPTGFEHAIANLARRDPAVHRAVRQGGANDRGLDVLVRLRDGRRILIQCKRYAPPKNVTSGDVQKTNGTYRDIHRCDHAVIVTTTSYTPAAVQTNTMLARPLLLVDGPALAAWTAGGPPPWAGIAA